MEYGAGKAGPRGFTGPLRGGASGGSAGSRSARPAGGSTGYGRSGHERCQSASTHELSALIIKGEKVMTKEIGCLSKKSMIACLALTALAMVVTSRTAVGQYSTASLAGTVTDPSGASIPGAQVTVQNNATGFTQTFAT